MVAGQQLVRSLPVEQHLDAGAMGELHDSPLRVGPGGRNRLVLSLDEAWQLLDQLEGCRRGSLASRARRCQDLIDEARLVESRLVVEDAEASM